MAAPWRRGRRRDRDGVLLVARVVVIPRQVGPVRIEPFAGELVAVTCPRDFDPVMRKAAGLWQRHTRVWLLERRRLGPVVRALRAATDPLLRRAGLDLDT